MSIRTKLQALLDAANDTTDGSAEDLTAAVQALIDGYGGGGDNSKLLAVLDRTTPLTLTASDLQGLTKLGGGAFYSAANLISIELPDTVLTTERNAFAYCTRLTSIKFGNGVTTIGAGTCSNNAALTTIEIGTGIISIGSTAFNSLQLLSEFICRATTPPTIQSNTFNDVPAECKIYVPAASVAAYKAATNWSTRAYYIRAIV